MGLWLAFVSGGGSPWFNVDISFIWPPAAAAAAAKRQRRRSGGGGSGPVLGAGPSSLPTLLAAKAASCPPVDAPAGCAATASPDSRCVLWLHFAHGIATRFLECVRAGKAY